MIHHACNRTIHRFPSAVVVRLYMVYPTFVRLSARLAAPSSYCIIAVALDVIAAEQGDQRAAAREHEADRDALERRICDCACGGAYQRKAIPACALRLNSAEVC